MKKIRKFVYVWRRSYSKRNDTNSACDCVRVVVVLCASPDSVREIMIKVHELNFDNGEYVFINIDLFSR